MPNFPTQQQINELKDFSQPYCVSIYAPYLEPNTADNPNRIEVKNLLRQARKKLLDHGQNAEDVEEILNPAYEFLIESQEFWPPHHAAIALFMYPKFFRYYYIADNVPVSVTVKTGFNLGPLLKILSINPEYYVLNLNHNNVQLFTGDRYSLNLVQIKGMPKNLKETLRIDEIPNWSQTHAVAPASMGKGSERFHGQYNETQTDKEMLTNFFRQIDKKLHKFLNQQQKPLIIAGVDYLLPIYRGVNTYQKLLPKGITGNVEHTNLEILRQKALDLLTNKDKLN